MVNNRIAKYIKEMSPSMAKVVIVSDVSEQKVTLTIQGSCLVWRWKDSGLLCPGSSNSLMVDPLAAETLILKDIEEFLGMEGVSTEEVAHIDSGGNVLSSVYFHPKCLGEPTYPSVLAKTMVRHTYSKYCDAGRKISVEMIGEAISCGALGALLSLINL